MENNIFEELYKDFTKVDINKNKITNMYSYRNSENGNFYMDDNNLYPSVNILDEDNKEYYEQFFDFDIEELSNISKEDIEIVPAKISGKTIEKGTIKVKEKEEVIEETPAIAVEEEPKLEVNEELENLRKEALETLENFKEKTPEFDKETKERILECKDLDSLRIEMDNLNNYIAMDAKMSERIEQFKKESETPEEIETSQTSTGTESETREEIREENITKEIINFEEFKETLDKNSRIDKELIEILNKKTELTKNLEILKEKYNKALRNGYNGIFKQGENTTDFYPQIKNIEQQLVELDAEIKNKENEKTDINKYIETINNTDLSNDKKEKFIEELNLYVNITKEKETLENNKKEKIEELENINTRYKEAVRRASLMLPGENTADLYQQLNKLKQDINDIEEQIKEKEEKLKEIENSIKENNKIVINKYSNDRDELINIIKGFVDTINLDEPEEKINKKLDEIEKYLIELNKLDQLAFEEKYKNAKTDEEKQQLISEREKQVESYRDLLKHENKDIEELLGTRFNPLIDKFKNEIVKDKEKTEDKPEETPEIPEEDPKETEEQEIEIPKKSKLKVVAKKALKLMKEHKLVIIAIGLALTTALLFAIPTTHMMINSALWSVGSKLGWSAGTLSNLHSINLGLSKAVAGGKYIFEGMSGAYTLGGAVGAQALYGAGSANLIGAITGLTGLGAIGTFGAAIVNKIKNWKKKKTPEKETPVEEPIKEQEEIIDVVDNKDKEKEIELEKDSKTTKETQDKKSTPLTKEQIAEMIKNEVEKAVAAKNKEIAKLSEENEALKSEIEMLKAQGLNPEDLTEESVMKK